MHKKFVAAFLAMTMLTGLTACSENNKNDHTQPAASESTSLSTLPPAEKKPLPTEEKEETTVQPTVTEETVPETTLVETQPDVTEPTVTEAAPEPVPTVTTAPKPTEPPHEHSYTANVVPPTCTDGGYTLHSCSCGKQYQDQETPATGHSWGEWQRTKDPTIQEEGEETRTCATCGGTEKRAVEKLKPAPLDYSAAMAYGNSYAQQTYGALPGSHLNFNNAGFCPYGDYWLERIQGLGQEYLLRKVRENIDATFSYLSDTGGYEGAAINIDIHEATYSHEHEGYLYIYVYYG